MFLAGKDTFYEGAFNNQVRFLPRGTGIFSIAPLWIITNGYLWQVRKYLNPGARVVELGCAGGVAWFGKQFAMVGIDVSHEGLAIAAQYYETCLQAENLRAIPDESVDGVISSYFWEHIAPPSKVELLDEILRVLRPGGRVVFVYDVATKNPLISWLRRLSPQLYQALFIDADGHHGYQSADENDALFRAHGFEVVKSVPMERTLLQSTSVFQKMKSWPGAARPIGRAMSLIDNSRLLYLYLAFLRIIDVSVGRLFPRSWGRITITVAVKPGCKT